MASHFQRLERLEANLDSIVKVAATKKDVEGLRTEYRKLLEAEVRRRNHSRARTAPKHAKG